MKNINVAAACLNQTALDWKRNLTNIKNAIQDASDLGVQLLCLPELCITGYGAEDAFFSKYVQEKALATLNEITSVVPNDMVVSVGLPLVHRNALYNVSAIIIGRQVFAFIPKQHLCSDGIHYEPRWFKPWPKGIINIFEFNDERISIGDETLNIGGVKISLEVCEDAWVADRPGISFAARGTDIILNPSASHFAFGKHQIRKRFVEEGSRAFKCVYIYSNLLGNETGRVIFDGDMMIASGGRVIAEGRRLSFLPHMILASTVDVDENRTNQLQNGSFIPDLKSYSERVISFNWNEVKSILNTSIDEIYGIDPVSSKEREFLHAVALGLHDYREKSKSKGYVVSLSGGADSSAVCCLVRASLDIAAKELKTPIRAKETLTTVYQSTINSSDATRLSAATVALELGSDHKVLDIEPVVKDYQNIIECAIDRELTWEEDDIALQNIQARVRLPSIWMLANIRNQLLLCTSNRSEAAVGYSTAGGDLGGGIAPIAGIDKTFLLHWLQWLSEQNEMYTDALRYVLNLVPTAELRPAESKQSDEDDLMPYYILNTIEEYAIRDKMSPKDVLHKLCMREDIVAHEDILRGWVIKFFKLWARNQWKREQCPLTFHLDDHNLDPKTWCRFPILSGNFEDELAELNPLPIVPEQMLQNLYDQDPSFQGEF